jgi:hypothetical protein
MEQKDVLGLDVPVAALFRMKSLESVAKAMNLRQCPACQVSIAPSGNPVAKSLSSPGLGQIPAVCPREEKGSGLIRLTVSEACEGTNEMAVVDQADNFEKLVFLRESLCALLDILKCCFEGGVCSSRREYPLMSAVDFNLADGAVMAFALGIVTDHERKAALALEFMVEFVLRKNWRKEYPLPQIEQVVEVPIFQYRPHLRLSRLGSPTDATERLACQIHWQVSVAIAVFCKA